MTMDGDLGCATRGAMKRRTWRPLSLFFPTLVCSWVALLMTLQLTQQRHVHLTLQPTLAPKCEALNSRHWLDGPRYGNMNDTNVKQGPFRRQDTHYHDLMSESLCHKDSPLVQGKGTDEATTIRLWTVALVYLVAHVHQHEPAWPEVHHRQRYCSTHELQAVGNFDFECPSAKFLVVRFFKNGLGANVRLGAVPALMAGLATSRIVLFINNAPDPPYLREPWSHASCPRHDAQCIFRPTSPCVLTHDDLAKASVLKKNEMRSLFRTGRVPDALEGARVLLLELTFRPQRVPPTLRAVIHERAVSLLDHVVQDAHVPERSILQQAAHAILIEDHSPIESYDYYGVDSPLFHGLLLYAMRPNPRAAQAMKQVISDMFPPDFDPNRALGMPIRASDKCMAESECLNFSQSMVAAQQLWRHHATMSSPPSIVFSTESSEIFAEYESYAKSHANQHFIVNTEDVRPNSGFLEHSLLVSADDAMLSAMVSLQSQLQTSVAVGNCCSNFHLIMADLFRSGCGTSANHGFTCLQDHPDPTFRVCCSWDTSPACRARRSANHSL